MVKLLLEYQDMDSVLISIEKELSTSEIRKRLSRARNFLNDVDATVAKMDKRALELNATYEKLLAKNKEYEEEITEYANLSDKSKDEAELKYFAKKVVGLDESLKAHEGQIKEVLAEVKTLLASFEEFRGKVKTAKEDYAKAKEDYDTLKTSKQAEVEQINKKLAALEKKIDKELMEKYKKIRLEKVFPVLAKLEGDNCGGCRMEIALNKVSDLKAKGIAICDECRRILYVEQIV